MRWFTTQPKRNEIQEKALEHALSIYNSDPEKYKDTMFCPYCGEPLVKTDEKRRLQTLSEHVSGDGSYASEKDVYVCPGNYYGENIPGCKYGALHIWNGDWFGENGGSYSSDFWMETYEKKKNGDEEAINLLHEDWELSQRSALNTFECETQTSIYNEGLTKGKRLPAWITFNLIQLTLNYDYQADRFGQVTKTNITLGFLKKDKHFRDGFSIVGTWPWDTWKYLYRKFNRSRKYANKIKDKEKRLKALKEAYDSSINRDFIYKAFEWTARNILHPFEYKKIQQL